MHFSIFIRAARCEMQIIHYFDFAKTLFLFLFWNLKPDFGPTNLRSRHMTDACSTDPSKFMRSETALILSGQKHDNICYYSLIDTRCALKIHMEYVHLEKT